MAGLTPDNRDAYIRMGYEVDQASINTVLAANTKVESSLNTVQKAADSVGAEAVKTSNRLKDAFAQSRSAIEGDTKAINELRESLTKVKPASEIFGKSGGIGTSGGVGVEGLRRTGGALRQLGAEGLGEGIGRVGDIAEIGKEFKALEAASLRLPGILGKVTTEAAAMGGSMGLVVGVLGPATLAIGAITIAVGELNKRWEEGRNAIKAYLEEQDKETEQKIRLAKDAKNLTSAQLKDQQEAAKQEYDIRQKDIEAKKKQLAEIERQYTELGSSLDPIRRAALGEAGKQFIDNITALQLKNNELAKTYNLNQKELEPLIKKREEETAAIQAALTAIDQRIASEMQLNTLLRTGTAKQVEDRLAALADEKKAIEDNLPALEEQAKKSREGADTLQKYKDRLAEIDRQQKELNGDLLDYLKAKEAEKQYYADAIKGNEEFIKNQQKYADLIATGSSDEVKKRIEAIEREKKAIQDGLPTLDALGESNEEARKKAQEYRKRLDELNEEEGQLITNVKPLIEAREAETKAIEKQKQQAGIAQKLEDDLLALDDKTAQERISINEKYHDKLIEITRNAVDEATKALTELQQKQADLRTSLTRDEEKAGRDAADQALTTQIKAQRAERDALQEHLQRLQEIKKSDYAADQKDLLDRNFQNIYLRGLQKNQQVDQENVRYGQEAGKRQQAIQDEINDASRQRQIERRERLIAYQQQVQDANTAYQRQIASAKQAKDKELLLAREAHDRELKDLQAKHEQEFNARQKAAIKELHLLDQTEAQRLEIISKYAKKANDLINRAMTNAVVKRAGGGYLESGQLSMVNEPGSSGMESFNGVPLPGAGLFMPMQAGYVSPSGGGGNTTISVPVTVNGAADPATTARMVQEQVIYAVKKVMGR